MGTVRELSPAQVHFQESHFPNHYAIAGAPDPLLTPESFGYPCGVCAVEVAGSSIKSLRNRAFSSRHTLHTLGNHSLACRVFNFSEEPVALSLINSPACMPSSDRLLQTTSYFLCVSGTEKAQKLKRWYASL